MRYWWGSWRSDYYQGFLLIDEKGSRSTDLLPFFNIDILMITIYQAEGDYNETSI